MRQKDGRKSAVDRVLQDAQDLDAPKNGCIPDPCRLCASLGRRENKAPCFKVREQKTLVLTSPVIHKL